MYPTGNEFKMSSKTPKPEIKENKIAKILRKKKCRIEAIVKKEFLVR